MSVLPKNLRSMNLSQIGLAGMRYRQGLQGDCFSKQFGCHRRASYNPINRYIAPTRRNNILTAQSAARRQQLYNEYDEMYTTKMCDIDINENDRRIGAVFTTGQTTENPQVTVSSKTTNEDITQNQNNYQMRGDEPDTEVQSIRETIFGKQDKDDEATLKGYLCDNELLKRVTAQKTEPKENNSLSRKVSLPYSSYNNHRSRWAEFRHSMIYGRSTF